MSCTCGSSSLGSGCILASDAWGEWTTEESKRLSSTTGPLHGLLRKKKKVFCSHPREVTIYILPHPSITKCIWVLRKRLNAYSHCLRSSFCKGFVLCNVLLLCFDSKDKGNTKLDHQGIRGCSVAELCSAINSRLAMIENSSVVLLSMSCGFLEWAAWLWGIHQSEGTPGAFALPATNDCILHQYQAQGCKREDFSS